MDYYQKRYHYEKEFKYSKFLHLDQPYTEDTELGDINLIIQTYPIQKPDKLEELLLCLHNNLNNKCIKKVYNLYEGHIDFLPEHIKNHNKLINIKIQKNRLHYTHTHVPDFSKFKSNRYDDIRKGYEFGGINENTDISLFENNLKERLSWNYFIDFCLKTFKDNEIVCVANSDIIIEDSPEWYYISDFLNDKGALCLSRHEIDRKGDVFLDFWAFKCWSQDCWVFKKTDKMRTLESKIDFSIGNCMGCDNVIAGIAGANKYIPINYAFKYRIFHLDRVTKIETNKVLLSYKHDNRIVENIDEFPKMNVCPFLQYEKLLLLPMNKIIEIINTNNICCNKSYHKHDN